MTRQLSRKSATRAERSRSIARVILASIGLAVTAFVFTLNVNANANKTPKIDENLGEYQIGQQEENCSTQK